MSTADARFVPPDELIAVRELALERASAERPDADRDEMRGHALDGSYDRHVSDELAAYRPKEWNELCEIAYQYAVEHSDGYYRPSTLALFAENGWLGSLLDGHELDEILEVHPRFRPLVEEWGVAEWAA